MKVSVSALLLIVVLGLAAGLLLMQVGKPPEVVPASGVNARLRPVYADLSALARLHPAYAIVVALDKQSLPGGISDAGTRFPGSERIAELVLPVSPKVAAGSREKLEKTAVNSADQSMQVWEKAQRESLQQRVDWLNRNRMSVVESLTRLEAAERNKAAATDRRKRAEGFQYPWLNGRFDERALELSRSVLGFKPPGVEDRLKSVTQELARLNSDFRTSVEAINESAANDIDTIRLENSDAVRREVSAFRLSEQRRIDRAASAGKARSARRLTEFGKPVEAMKLAPAAPKVAVAERGLLTIARPAGADAAGLDKARVELVRRLSVETAQAVLRIAGRERLSVQFSRVGPQVPDYTPRFREALKNQVWGAALAAGEKSGKASG